MKSFVRLYASGPFTGRFSMPNLSVGSGSRPAAAAISREAVTAESWAASWRERSEARRCASVRVSKPSAASVSGAAARNNTSVQTSRRCRDTAHNSVKHIEPPHEMDSAARAATVSAGGGSDQEAAKAESWRRIGDRIALQAQPVRCVMLRKRYGNGKSRRHRRWERELVCGSRELLAVTALQRAKVEFRNGCLATIAAVRVRRDCGCRRHARLDARPHREGSLREQQSADQDAADGAKDFAYQ